VVGIDHEEIACIFTVMTTNEFRFALDRIGCTGAQLARWLGVSKLTVTRWRTGAVEVTGPAALAVKALADGWRP
jgi:DNA-binding transcriptional regulator YiaG